MEREIENTKVKRLFIIPVYNKLKRVFEGEKELGSLPLIVHLSKKRCCSDDGGVLDALFGFGGRRRVEPSTTGDVGRDLLGRLRTMGTLTGGE